MLQSENAMVEIKHFPFFFPLSQTLLVLLAYLEAFVGPYSQYSQNPLKTENSEKKL